MRVVLLNSWKPMRVIHTFGGGVLYSKETNAEHKIREDIRYETLLTLSIM